MRVATGHAITLDEVTPVWLTQALQRAGVLPTGRVTDLVFEPNAAFNSHTRHLQPIYSWDAPDTAPARLLLKCSLPAAWARRAGAREVAFYQTVQSLSDHPPVIVPCHDAACDFAADGTVGNSHLLLADLSDSHTVAVSRDQQLDFATNLPSATHLEQAVAALAHFHAYWWGKQAACLRVGQVTWGCHDEASVHEEMTRRQHAWQHLLATEGSALPTSIQHIYTTCLTQMLPLYERHMRARVEDFEHLTLTHGDAYLANFLSPHNPQGATYIIDWQSPEPYRGPTDLVNMCATFWTREQRADGERELNVLRHYYRTLQESGVRGYAWEQLLTDYQLSILDWLWVPVQDAADGSGKDYWWPKMQCLVDAFEDWRCAELFV